MWGGVMRENPVKAELAAGGRSFGTMMFEFASPGVPQILVNAGCQYVTYDMEHSGLTEDEIKRQFAYCRGLGLVPLVRPAVKNYATVARLLDLGAMGFLFQMVESVEEAREFVSWTRYPPDGVRGAMFSGAHDDYTSGDVVEKMLLANQRTLVMALIETPRGVERAADIMAVDGVDVGHVGHFDLSLTMGMPAQFDHAEFKSATDRVLRACKDNGKAAGCAVPDVTWGRNWMERGFRMISYSMDIALLGDSLSSGIRALREAN